MKFYARKENGGKLKLTQPKTYENYVYSLLDGSYIISIDKIKKVRSNPANRYYWAEVVEQAKNCLVDDWGDIIETQVGAVHVNSEFAHEWLLKKFNSSTVVNEAGESETITIRTSKGQGSESENFYKYVERCKKGIFTQWGVTCREPGEQLEIE